MMVICYFDVLLRHGPHREAESPSGTVQRIDTGREGVIELEVGLGSLVACGILYFARAGHHEVDLVGDVRLDLEIKIRGTAICGRREGDVVGRGGLGIDHIEAGIALSPGPLQRRDQGAGSVSGSTVEPFGAAHRKAGRRAAITQRTKAGVDGGFHAGPCTRLGQYGVDALGGSFDQAGVGQPLYFQATRGQVFTRKALCLLAGNNGSTRGGGTLRLDILNGQEKKRKRPLCARQSGLFGEKKSSERHG